MNITAKSRYALKIMMDLADKSARDCDLQQRQKIADRQGIPLDFMDQIMARLRHHGLVESLRGRAGGFVLKKSAHDISLWEIFSSVEDSLFPVKCMEGEGCELEINCISHGVWEDVFSTIKRDLSEMLLSDMLKKWRDHKNKLHFDSKNECPPNFIKKECPGPERKLNKLQSM